ncbi:GNAT family N-acetyltransferase [Aerococcaceae bacterium NML171108]|nr:GNAT family N-acetyltransferase [Aerococcaceae bacterium NML171108]
MTWMTKHFDELTTAELHAIYLARVEVFVVEQKCPYPEVDMLDTQSLHIFQWGEEGIAAYCRLIPEDTCVHLGRVLVAQPYRQTGLGKTLVAHALEVCQQHFPNLPVHAQAQAYLEKFYAEFGFKAVSDVYLEDDIPHIDMIKS